MLSGKICFGCDQLKPLDDFHACIKGVFGRQTYCKSCHNAQSRARHVANRVANKDAVNARHRAYRALHRDRINAQERRRYTARKENAA